MLQIFGYVKEYVSGLNKIHFLAVTLLVSSLIILNYSIGMENRMHDTPVLAVRAALFYILFCVTFCLSYFIVLGKNLFSIRPAVFYVLLTVSPIIFAVKMSISSLPASLAAALNFPSFAYWTVILQWPLKLSITALAVWILWKSCRIPGAVAGLAKGKSSIIPYFIMLLLLIPFIFIAAGSTGFQQVYPKIRMIAHIERIVSDPFPYRALFELAYASDFFTIELFFRGFLVLAFGYFAGEKAILPMAAFYCTIHFGKPLPECIGSYFGGLILGAIVYRSRSIWGGLLVHVGIAMIMEAAGLIAASHQL